MKQPKPRVIITTDMEVDDMNSLIHLALHLNELDVEAVVYTASQYHFQGDGHHTLGEVTPHYRTSGRLAYEGRIGRPHPDPDAAALTSYRPFPGGWIESLWRNEYAAAWPHLCENAPGYPAPQEMLACTHVGNVAFEGDVRHDTEGSDAIKAAIMDDDPRTLWLLSWGGANTIVRALMSIAEEWQGTPTWDMVRSKVCDKVRIMGVAGGVGQDNSWLDHGRPLFPELKLVRTECTYGHYLSAKMEQPDCLPLFQAPWPKRNLIDGNGPLMARYHLYGDGKVYEGEPDRFQFGVHPVLDWGFDGMDPIEFEPFDFLAEGDSMTYIPLLSGAFGLRGPFEDGFETLLGRLFVDETVDGAATGAPEPVFDWYTGTIGSPNPYERAYQEEFAARAQWCAHGYGECNHAPRISDVAPDTTAAPGGVVELAAKAADPDGDRLHVLWQYDPLASTYAGNARTLRVWEPAHLSTHATVPQDARAGDRLVFTLEVQDTAERPLTRYAQVAVTVD